MVELDLKKITAPDFTVWSALIITGPRRGRGAQYPLGAARPWLNRQGPRNDPKQGAEISGVALSI